MIGIAYHDKLRNALQHLGVTLRNLALLSGEFDVTASIFKRVIRHSGLCSDPFLVSKPFFTEPRHGASVGTHQ